MSINFIGHGERRATRRTAPREWKGWMVLVFMLAFFGVVIGVNVLMAHLAVSTFGGVDVDSSYRAGQMFEHDVAMAETQNERHWRVDGKITRAADGTTALDVAARDSTGTALTGLTAMALFTRPTDRRLDRTVVIREDEDRPLPRRCRAPARSMGSCRRTHAPGRAAVPLGKSRDYTLRRR